MPGNRLSQDATSRCISYSQLTISTTVFTLPAAFISNGVSSAVRADFVLAATNGIRYTLDGSTPTAGLGIPVAGGSSFSIYGIDNIRRFQAIRSGAADAVADAQSFG